MIEALYKTQYEVTFYTKMSKSNLCQHWDVPHLLKQGTAWNDLKPAETAWCHLQPPSSSQNHPGNTCYYLITQYYFLLKTSYSLVILP